MSRREKDANPLERWRWVRKGYVSGYGTGSDDVHAKARFLEVHFAGKWRAIGVVFRDWQHSYRWVFQDNESPDRYRGPFETMREAQEAALDATVGDR